MTINKGLITIIIACITSILIVLAFIKDSLVSVFVAIGTLSLAAITWWSISSSDRRERRRTQSEIDKEDRDRTERYLNEIISWLTALEGRIFQSGKPIAEEHGG